MKKLTLIYAMIGLGLIAFASGKKDPDPYELSFGGSLNAIVESGTVNDEAMAAGFSSYGIHMQSSKFFKSSNWGLVCHVGGIFPYAVSVSDGDTTVTTDTSEFNSLFGITGIFGFPYYFIKNEIISLGIGPVANYVMLSASTDTIAMLGYYFGAGLQLNSQVRIADDWFLSTGAIALYDFYAYTTAWTATTTNSWGGRSNAIMWNPYIGIGYRIFNKNAEGQ